LIDALVVLASRVDLSLLELVQCYLCQSDNNILSSAAEGGGNVTWFVP